MRFEDTQVEPAFLCPCKCSSSHAATVCHFLYGGSYTSYMDCLQQNRNIDWLPAKGTAVLVSGKGETCSVQGIYRIRVTYSFT